jgi:hypothetical protein
MNLNDGLYKDTPLKQVRYGGMCAYLIKESDKNIKEPIARIAIKRLVNKNEFIFVAEPRIYGDTQFAQELNFANEVNNILNNSNKETAKNEFFFTRKDGKSYSDRRD